MQGLDRPRSFDIGLVVNDDSRAAIGIARALRSIPILEISEKGMDAEQQALRDGDRDAVMVIPRGFGEALQSGGSARVRAFYDPSRQTVAQIVIPILSRIVGEVDRGISGTPRRIDIQPVSVAASDLSAVDLWRRGSLP